MRLLQMLKEDIKTQQHLLEIYRKALSTLPKGKLRYRMMNGRVRYFRYNPETGKVTYLKDADKELVHKLKYRRVTEEAIRTIESNLNVEEKLLETYQPYDPVSCQMRLGKVYQDAPELFYEKKGKHRKRENYQNSYRKEDLIHKTSFGMLCRSKSEAMIADLLYKAGIPFYYEARLILYDEWGEKQVYYPDFTIELPDGSVIYWEHFGRMDLPDYRQKNFKRIANYHYNDIYPPNNLIITMESRKGGIDANAILRIIEHQILPFFQ